MLTGKLNIPDAKAVARLPEEQRKEIVEKLGSSSGLEGTTSEAYEIIQEAKREGHRRNREEEDRRYEEKRRIPPTAEEIAQKAREQEEQEKKWAEERKARKELDTARTTKVKEQLNEPDKAQIRLALYKAAYETNMLVVQGLRSYLAFLIHFAVLVEGTDLAESPSLLERVLSTVRPNLWGDHMYQLEKRAGWLREFVGEEYDGSYENLLNQCEGNKRLFEATGVPYIDFADLQ